MEGNWLSWGPPRVHNTFQWVRNPALEVFATVHGAIFNTGEKVNYLVPRLFTYFGTTKNAQTGPFLDSFFQISS